MVTTTKTKGGTKVKIEIIPEVEYTNRGLKEGWITLQRIRVKNLIIDHAYQARVIPIDHDHVKLLADTRQALIDSREGQSLHPIVVFETPKYKYLVADGFHRIDENRIRKCPDILAHVVKVDDWEHQARLYAAMCNRLAMKKKGKEDSKKAVEILFGDDQCWTWSDARIGNLCGCTRSMVSIIRTEFSVNNQIELPASVVSQSGQYYGYAGNVGPRMHEYKQKPDRKKQKKGFYTKIGTENIHLGVDRSKSEERFNQLLEEKRKSKNAQEYSVDNDNLKAVLARFGFSFNSANKGGKQFYGLRGFYGHGCFVTGVTFEDHDIIAWATGCLLMLREISGNPSDRLVVVCYPDDGPSASIEVSSKLGIEFLTPDELIASLKDVKS